MDSLAEAARYARILGPEVPGILVSGVKHSLGLSPESSKWDARTNLVITSIRAFLSRSSTPVTRQQVASMRDPGVRGSCWAAPVVLPVEGVADDSAEFTLRTALFDAIDALKDDPAAVYDRATLAPVEAEWQGYRKGVKEDALPPKDASPSELYTNLMADTSSEATILYFHGGALYLMDPATHRPICSRLSKQCGGRALSVRYRLAPQHPFPAGLLDCLVAYLSLLYPPQGALHAAVKPEKVVFSGDSAGGNLSFAMIALLLQMRRTADTQSKTFKFNGHDVPLAVPLPGGVAVNSPWTDLTRSMPSLVTNNHYDYLPLPSMKTTATPAPPVAGADTPDPTFTFSHTKLSTRIHIPGETANVHPCAAWPEIPTRADLYTDGSMLTHPLVSPLAVPVELWKGAPPTYIECGEEMLGDEIGITARRLAKAGVPTRWVGFEAMPHCFVLMFGPAKCAKATVERGFESWGDWIAARVGNAGATATKMTGGTWIAAPSLKESDVSVEGLAPHVSEAECDARMREEKRRRCEAFAALTGSAKL